MDTWTQPLSGKGVAFSYSSSLVELCRIRCGRPAGTMAEVQDEDAANGSTNSTRGMESKGGCGSISGVMRSMVTDQRLLRGRTSGVVAGGLRRAGVLIGHSVSQTRLKSNTIDRAALTIGSSSAATAGIS